MSYTAIILLFCKISTGNDTDDIPPPCQTFDFPTMAECQDTVDWMYKHLDKDLDNKAWATCVDPPARVLPLTPKID